MNRIHITVTAHVYRLPLAKEKIIRLVKAVFQGEKIRRVEIDIAVVGDRRMTNLTEHYTHRRYQTDVLAFDLSDDDSDTLTGQIVVNSQRARDQAKRLKTSASAELAMYIIHGVLHLCGYDDRTDRAARKMHHRTFEYLKQTGFKNLPPLPDI